MGDSRIFVSGLPTSLREDQFRSHFESFAPVTDVKLLSQRRIGYVGYRSNQDAAQAVKHFNKTFIRMSRIRVELANNSLPALQTNHPTPLNNEASDQPINHLKRKRDQQDKSEDGKWKEYLELMKPPTQIRTWDANPEFVAPRDSAKPSENFEESNTESKTDHNEIVKNDSVSSLKEPPLQYDPDMDLESPSGGLRAPASDADWMRTRTSRLLGLVDDDDDNDDDDADGIHRGEDLGQDPSISDASPQRATTSSAPPQDSKKNGDEQETPPDFFGENYMRTLDNNDRLFVRNLPYNVTEIELERYFKELGSIEEIHVPRDPKSGHGKGFAFIKFTHAEEASEAYRKCDGAVFHGRLLHIIPAAAKRTSRIDDPALSNLPLKKQRQIQKKSEANSSSFSWNSLFMNANSVLSSISDRLGVAKSEILDPSSSDASVKLAQAETHVIQDTKEYFAANGINLDAFKNRERDDSSILVKNFPYGTTSQDLKQLFSAHGEVSRVLMPSSGTIAIVKFELSVQAKAAFASLAYRKYKESILFLEKAPKGVFKRDDSAIVPSVKGSAPKVGAIDLLQPNDEMASGETASLYVRNLNFATSNETFRNLFYSLEGFISARIKTKPSPNKPGETLSMGFGFVEFRSAPHARAALAAMNGHTLDGHQLTIKSSHKGNDAAQERRNLDESKKRAARKSKLVIKNLPFEASKKDVRNLFKSYGQLRAVRVPKKFDNSRKGYAFAEFSNAKEAESALESLRNTHLLGRRLVLDYAAEDAADPEQEIKNTQRKIGNQANNVALQRLVSGSERRKIDITGKGNESE